jgi:hypothetical protein
MVFTPGHTWSKWRVRFAGGALLLSLAVSGCKTQEDAAAAASQMAATAQTMSAYYDALDQVVVRTQDTYQAQYALSSIPPMDLKETRDQIHKRAELAGDVAELAGIFQKIAGSTAASDAAGAADKLNTELVQVKALASNDTEATAVKVAVKEIVLLIQEHKEVEAAKKVAPLSAALSKFFNSEAGLYDSLNESYLRTAQSVAHELVKRDQVDSAAVFGSALKPFDLTPAIDSQPLKQGMHGYLDAQIDSKFSDDLAASKKATAALSAALKEMDTRIELVAGDKPMKLRVPPFSLGAVQGWISEVSK